MAHPVPDVPVRAHFDSDGSARFEVEVDLRCFAEDPENEPYYIYKVLKSVTDERKQELKGQVHGFLEKTMSIWFPPSEAPIDPKFTVTFGRVGGGDLEDDEDPVALIASCEIEVPQGAGYQLEALETGQLSVLFLNHLDGIRQKRMQVLFPGEKSKVLPLDNIAEDAIKGAASPEEPNPAGGLERGESDRDDDSDEAAAASSIYAQDYARAAAVESASADQGAAENNRSTLKMVAFVGVGLGLAVAAAVLLGRH